MGTLKRRALALLLAVMMLYSCFPASVSAENEVDLILLHSTVPVFVSCKNRFVSSDELYKLDSVSRRFGGKYAKHYPRGSGLPGVRNVE